MAYPSREKCLAILVDAGAPEQVVSHIEAVADLAIEIAEAAGADVALVTAGAMLHDIGRAGTHSIGHAAAGADMLRERGLPEEVVLIVERHVGAGVTRSDAARMGLPDRDYIPRTLEQKVVAHADNMVDETERQPIAMEVARMRRKGLMEQAEMALAMHRELSKRCGFDLDVLVNDRTIN